MRYLLPLLVLGFTSRLTAADVDFARDVLPILSDHCFACHGPDANARKADLRLDAKDDALRKESPVIVPGKSGDSELVRRVTVDDESELMPPPKFKKPLTAKQVETLKQWVDQGAKWGRHWAFEPPRRPENPSTKSQIPIKNPIDAFVFARLEREGLKPSSEADKATLIRRVTLDLTGLPPTPEEVDAFVKDTSPDVYEKVVDRLLASPRYGERMAWEWLDAARYADSNGYQGDNERTMWPWRAWAVKALNADVPFDRLTVEQLAGDLLPDATRDQKLATGFLRNHMINGEGGRIPEENRIEYVFDMTETVGTVWLGLTLNCCRCHDHKYDPVAQKEYYAFFAFFNQTPVTGAGGNPQTEPVVEFSTPEDGARLKAAREKAAAEAKELTELERLLFPGGKSANDSAKAKDLPKEVRDVLAKPVGRRSRDDLAKLEKHFAPTERTYSERLKELAGLNAARDEADRRIPRVMVMEDQAKLRDTFVLTKGLYNKPADKVSAGVPAALPPLPEGAARNRLALARWLVSKDNPLTARVVVNRYWQKFFGVGLVKTVEDFGVQGERPGNQELLDWLAVEFMEPATANGRRQPAGDGPPYQPADAGRSPWSLKHLVRLIVTSATYRQSSKVMPALAERDPENRLLARGPRFRMPSWMVRDQALAVSGLLVEKPGGVPVHPYQPPGVWEETTFGLKKYSQGHGDDLYRRSLYTFWRRIVGPTMFFDAAARQTCTVKQARTNTPLHALSTLNDTTYVEAARALAQRAMKAETGDAERIALAVRLVLAREPSVAEAKVLLAGLDRLRKQYKTDPAAAKKLLAVGESKRDEKLDAAEHAAMTGLCLTILNTDEALTKE
ncbi:MAG TPA: PSD1 and planctomycete cytochrome C domain-containing protein [Fimbriiglobus sp.]|nr:PSD1 and planctomycete cytochrome C domain-containing protein [Fimbriiglobus sp.]